MSYAEINGTDSTRTTQADTVVIGIGNPYLGDDGVGPLVAHRLIQEYHKSPELDVLECPVGGLRLMEIIAPYKQAIIIDAFFLDDSEYGNIVHFGIDDLRSTKNQICQHDTNLANAALFMKQLGGTVPEDIAIIGITTPWVEEYSTGLSKEVSQAADQVVLELAKKFDLRPSSISTIQFEEFLA